MKKSFLIAISIFPIMYCYSQKINSSRVDSVFKNGESIKRNAIGKPFPLFKVTNGLKQWSNESLLGKTVYINFWFAACSPCMAEMPQVNELYKKFKEDTNFVFLSISFDNQEKINAVKSKYQIEYDVFSVPIPECMRLNPSRSFPASIVLDKTGEVKFYDTGGMGIGWLTTRHFKRKIYPAIENSLNGR